MRPARAGDILGACPGRPGTEPAALRRPTMRSLRTAAVHARYLLSSLAAVAFGLSLN
jgi:hypothetical protein